MENTNCFGSTETLASFNEVPQPEEDDSENWSVIGCFDSNETLASLSEVPLSEEHQSEEEQDETSCESETWSVIGCFDPNETLASLNEEPLSEEDDSENWSVTGCFDSNETLASLSEVPLSDKEESEEEQVKTSCESEDWSVIGCFDPNETLASLNEEPLSEEDDSETWSVIGEEDESEEEQEENSWEYESLTFSRCFGFYKTISRVSEELLPSEEEEQAVAMDAIELKMTEEDHSAETTRLPEVKTACADTKPIPCKRKWWMLKCFRRTNRSQVKNRCKSIQSFILAGDQSHANACESDIYTMS
ncbi:uncharacterized protein [Dendrobates tinctorius]|uniref:uncharacterized protein n=1 Tax=Dendrobates tinctorius TaxID=92724 RepID=UPI003CC94A68